MNNQNTIEKINKFASKKKTAKIIKLMNGKHVDSELLCTALDALAQIGDEDSVNQITHYLDHEDSKVRITACKAGIGIGSEYMKTRVQYQLAAEKDSETKKAIQASFNAKYV